MDDDRTRCGGARTEGQARRSERSRWRRSWGAALLLASAALLMGAVLTVWSEAALPGG